MRILVAIDVDGDPRPVGELHYEARGKRETSVFRYLPSWETAGGFALAPTMPVGVPVHTAKIADASHASALPGPIADAAPDAWGRRIIAAQRRAAGMEPATDLDFLLGVSDACRWGALRFLDGNGRVLGETAAAAAVVELEQLSAAIARFERTGSIAPLLARFVAAASSPGGARPKAVVADGSKRLIAKFTSVNDQNKAIERAEVMALRLARLAGLTAPEATVVGAREMPIALIQRFDRIDGRRVHAISAQSFLGAATADEGDYADFVEQMRIHADAHQARELYGRVAFNVLVRSTDDHLKNHALIHEGASRWHLSPLFDVNPQPERHVQLKTGINGRFDGTVDNVLAGHAAFGLRIEKARALVSHIAKTVAEHWRPLAKEVGMSKADIEYYAPAFEHEEAHAAAGRRSPRGTRPRSRDAKSP